MDGMGEKFKGSDEVLHGSLWGMGGGVGKGNVRSLTRKGVKIFVTLDIQGSCF